MSPSQYTLFGANTQSVSLNLCDDNARSFFAWSQNWNSTWSNSLSNGSSYVTLGTAGEDVQLSNGPDSSGNTNMYTSAFYPFTLPYYFQTSGAVGSQLQKITANQITYGRGAVLRKGNVQFCYSLKSLTVDNNNIKFVAIPETPAYKIPDSLSTNPLQAETAMRKWEKENQLYSKLDSLNTVLLSEPFNITGKSSMIFSEQSGFLDTSSAVKALGGSGYITYKLELVDNATNNTIAAIKESKFKSTSLSPCKLSASNLNVDKVGTKTVRVKITISTNITGLQVALVSEFGTVDNIALTKSEVKELTLQAPEIIKEYALEQNYPNPFNPTTTIHYQIPNAGHVTLRIYDILGREVATLADGMEDIGSYSVTFDGGKLASGVYVMRLIAQSEEGKSFVKVRKLVLMK
ncbi:MAG: T9SS type A sorting domain-containing protein [Bacteroidota bacterium]